LKRICAWCGADLDPEGIGTIEGGPITHGICRPCMANLLGEVGTPLQEFLESLEVPILLVSGNLEVEALNPDAIPWVQEEFERVEGLLGGEVFQCANAQLPGGCGRTRNCSACSIRNSVEHTHATGEALEGVPATLNTVSADAEEAFDLRVSTEKVGDRVLLRIEAA